MIAYRFTEAWGAGGGKGGTREEEGGGRKEERGEKGETIEQDYFLCQKHSTVVLPDCYPW